jgi:hypothetical protein
LRKLAPPDAALDSEGASGDGGRAGGAPATASTANQGGGRALGAAGTVGSGGQTVIGATGGSATGGSATGGSATGGSATGGGGNGGSTASAGSAGNAIGGGSDVGGGTSTGLFGQVSTLLGTKCTGSKCHGTGGMQAGLATAKGSALYTLLTTPLPAATPHCVGVTLVTANDANSPLLKVVASGGKISCTMPKTEMIGPMPDKCTTTATTATGSCLTAAQIKIISDWIAAGAPQQ